MKFQPLQIYGGSYADDTKSWSAQDVLGWLPSNAESPGTKTPGMFKTPPGLRPFAEIEPGGGARPVRGAWNAEGKAFVVIGTTMYQLSNTGVFIPIGTIPGTGRVIFSHNQVSLGNQILAVNGSAGYIYDTRNGVFQRITDPGYPGAFVSTFIDGYFVQISTNRRFAFNSDVANGLEYNTLDRFTSEFSPDLLVSLVASNNELFLLSETSGEFFENTGASQQPFRSKRITMDRGCAGAYTVAKADNTVFWLGNNGYFYVLNGYAPQRISTRAIEQSILGKNWKQAFAFAWEDAGHTVIYWTFPDGLTWGYDTSTGLWHRRESYGLNRWRVNTMTFWNQEWYAGDFQYGRMWKMDWDYILEGDQEFPSERTTSVIHDNQNRIIIPRLELLMQVGQEETIPVDFPEQPSSPTLTPVLPDGAVDELWPGGTYVATGGTPPYIYTSRPGTVFPTGLGPMSTSGVVPSATPTVSGSGLNNARVTDSNGLFFDVADPFVIAPPPFPGVEPPTGIQVNGYALDVDIPLPEGIEEDDLLIMQAVCATLGVTANVVSAVSGWTLIEALQQVNDDTRHLRVGWYYKIADGTETGDVTVTGTQSCGWSGQIHRIEAGTYDPGEVPELEMDFIEGPLDVTCPTIIPSWGSSSVLCIAGIGFKYKEATAIPDGYPLPYNNVTENSGVAGTAYSAVGSCTGELSGISMSPGDYHRITGVAAIVTTLVVKAAP